MSVVSFSYSAWSARYPELGAWVTPTLAAMYFAEAGIYCDNTDTSLIVDATMRTVLLYQLTSHIAALNAPLNGQPSSPLVGRVSGATEGSVSVQVQMDMPPGSAQWYNSTKYGAAYWAATAQYRAARYIPGPRPNFQPYGVPGYYGR